MKKFNFVLCIFTVVLIFVLSKNIYAMSTENELNKKVSYESNIHYIPKGIILLNDQKILLNICVNLQGILIYSSKDFLQKME